MPDAVTDYLHELDTALRVGRRYRRRIIAETADHLGQLAGREQEQGLDRAAAAERAARRFGRPAELAAEFNADVARHGLNRASQAVAACGVLAFAAAGLSVQPGTAPRWPDGPAFGLVMQLWLQVPAACIAIALFLAVVAPWLRGTPLAGRPADLAGRSLRLASVLFLPVAVVAAGNLGAAVPLSERLPFAVVAVGMPVAAVWGLRAAGRASCLAGRADEQDVLDVVTAVGRTLAGRWAIADRAYRIACPAWSAARERFPQAMSWLDLRHHPWRAAVSVSVAAGLALKAPDLLAGDPDFLDAAAETVAVYVSFAVLGGILGLRGSTTRAVRNPVKIAVTG